MDEIAFEKALNKMQKYPEIFFEEPLGIDTTEGFQKEVLRAIAKFSRVAIRACHSMGKTWLLARCVLWFLFCYRGSIVITTAPTHRQVVKLLWGELASAYKNAPNNLGGRLITNELKIAEKWYAMGFSPHKEAGTDEEQKGSSFQGWHAPYIFIVFDEATGITPDIFKMAEGLTTSGKIIKWVCIGNPTTRNSEFFRLFSMADWKKIKIDCFQSPNMIANGFINKAALKKEVAKLKRMSDNDRLARIENYKKPVPHLLTAQWVLARACTWGLTHALFLSKALAEFPKSADNVMIDYQSVENSIQRERRRGNIRYVGIDVARFGPDKTVFTELMGFKETRVKRMEKKRGPEVAGDAILWIKEEDEGEETWIIVDGTGVGSGVVDTLEENQRLGLLPDTWNIVEVHFAQEVPEEDEKENYLNLKSFMFHKLDCDLQDDIDLLDESIYLEELTSLIFKITGKGKIQMESKEDYKKRTGRDSPDDADSLALANWGRYAKLKIGTFQKSKNVKPLTKRKDTRDTFGRISKRIRQSRY